MDTDESMDIFSFSKDLLDSAHNPNVEKEILTEITRRVEELLDENVDLLMSFLYRLDIDEFKLKKIMKLSGAEYVAQDLANLIWLRQKQRIKTKKDHKMDNK